MRSHSLILSHPPHTVQWYVSHGVNSFTRPVDVRVAGLFAHHLILPHPRSSVKWYAGHGVKFFTMGGDGIPEPSRSVTFFPWQLITPPSCAGLGESACAPQHIHGHSSLPNQGEIAPPLHLLLHLAISRFLLGFPLGFLLCPVLT